MTDDLTLNRRYPLPDPERSAAVDAARIRSALTGVDADMLVALQRATCEVLGRVLLARAADIAEGRNDAVPTAEAVRDYVATALADLIGSTSGTLDTLAALADALGNDPNFATTIMSLLATKADKTTVDQTVNDIIGAITATNATVTTKAATTWAQSLFDNRYTKAETNNLLASKRNNGSVVYMPDSTRYISMGGDGSLHIANNGSDVFTFQSDGNVWSKMFGFLTVWVDGKRDAAITASKSWATANLVSDIRQAGGSYAVGSAGGSAGEVIHRVQMSGTTLTVETKYLQKMVNGTWYTIAKA